MLEELLARHCAPALAGIKPASLVAAQKKDIPRLHAEVEALNGRLARTDICVEILCECDRRALLMVYRRKRLEAHLQSRRNRAFLQPFGYARTGKMEEDIAFLKTRLTMEQFPHEIGVFLGYPLYDIACFIRQQGKNCILCGEWKVYHRPEEAQKCFHRFKACRRALVGRMADGYTLEQIFCAA